MTNRESSYSIEQLEEMSNVYKENCSAKTGSMIICPVCGSRFKKTTYHKKFCSNQDKGGAKRCKAIFWNEMRWYKKES